MAAGSRTRAAGWNRRRWSCSASAASSRPPWPRSPARAGLTERTFFRHYADKREVLFAGAGALQELLVTALAGDAGRPRRSTRSPPRSRPRPALLQERREFARKRQAVIAANPELQRARADQARLAGGGAGRGAARAGVAEPAASLAAEAGIAVFKIAFERWIDDPGPQDFPQLMRESLASSRPSPRAAEPGPPPGPGDPVSVLRGAGAGTRRSARQRGPRPATAPRGHVTPSSPGCPPAPGSAARVRVPWRWCR